MSFLRGSVLYPETSSSACRSSRSEHIPQSKLCCPTFRVINRLHLLFHQHVSKDQSAHDPVGRPIMHRSAISQATGEAVYCDDIPKTDGELFMTVVTSARAHAKITWGECERCLSRSVIFTCGSKRVSGPTEVWMWARLCGSPVLLMSSRLKIFPGRKSERYLVMMRSCSLRAR